MDAPSATGAMAERLARLTPRQRALLLRQLAARAPNAAAEAIPATPSETGVRLPLSPAQRRFWLLERLQPGTGAYHVYAHYRLQGALDEAALQRAFAILLQRHESLRTVFREHAGQPYAEVVAEPAFALQRIDLRALPGAEREAAMWRLAAEETERPFDLQQAPLLRATLLQLGDHDHVLLLVLHHIVSDAWSRGVLFDEITRLYADPAALAAPALQYRDWVRWQLETAQQQRTTAQIAWWREALEGCNGVLDLPTDRPRSSAPAGRGARVHVALPQALVAGVELLARREGATLYMALLAAFQGLLARWSGQEEIVVGSPVANRTRPELEPLIGLFVNSVALRGDLSGDPSFRTLLARTRPAVLDALEHAEAPLEAVIDALQLERVPGRTPLFQSMFVLQNAQGAEPRFAGLSAQWLEPEIATTRFELTLSLGATPEGLAGVLDYDCDLFEAATMQRFAAQFESLLREALVHPERPLSHLELLRDQDRAELLALADGGVAPDAGCNTLFDLVATQAQRTPGAIAVLEPGRALSYRELLQRAQGLAWQLAQHGAGPEARVALLADRSAESIVAVLAILAAGAAYVPLDPGQPAERLLAMLADAAPCALLAPPGQEARAATIARALPVLATSTGGHAESAPPVPRHAGQLAYVIYTSGSTGRPKGVAIEHRSALNLVRGFQQRHAFAGQRLLMIPPLIFDASVGDVFPVLGCGATLVLHANPAELGAAELVRYCEEHRVTAIDAPAALWRRWTEGLAAAGTARDALPGLRLMMIGGESVPVEAVRRFAAVTAARVALCNHYGPTEASVCATMLATVDGREQRGHELAIGRPLPGVRVYVLDGSLRLAPRGVVGELCIGGVGVARGYFGDAALSAEKFLADPWSAVPGARLYRSGDLVRWNADGSLQFLGRRDQQTKLRGFRIELGEIEAALAAHPGVRAAAAAVHEFRSGDRRLVAYVIADAGVDAAQLRAHLAERLPDAMLPAAFVHLDAMPLTPNGKVDRRALPVPATLAAVPRELRAPRDDTERAVLEAWQKVLGRDDLSIDDDFFAAGGDSLATLPLVFELHARLGIELPLATVFAAPTIEGVARSIEALRQGSADTERDLEALVELPADIDPRFAEPASVDRRAPQAVLLTGATGFLGAYLLRELLDTTPATVHCLVRADDGHAGLQRVRANLEGYGLWRDGDAARLRPVLGDLAASRLGVSEAQFDALARDIDTVFHNGGQVNFLAPYELLQAANVGGTREVLRLATRHRIKPVHLVSTLGVYLTERYLETTVREDDPAPEARGQRGGYNESKWVAERLALAARARGLPVAVYRPARITGDSRSGVSNPGDYFSAWIKGCAQLGLAPHLPDEAFDMAPVDYVARAIVHLACGAGDANGAFHFFNGTRLPITEAVAELQHAGCGVREVPYEDWRQALLAAVAISRDNALAPFAGLFPVVPDAREPQFDCRATAAAVAPAGIVCPPADRALFARYLGFLAQRGLLPGAHAAAEHAS